MVLPLWIWVDLGVMAMKGYSTFPKLQNWSLTISFNLVSYPEHSLRWGLTPRQRCNWCILQLWSTEQYIYIYIYIYIYYMVESVTLGFMHFAIVGQSEELKKTINIINFLFEKWGLLLCLCVCVPKFVCYWMLVCWCMFCFSCIHMCICLCM